ncbi:sugar phosphate isomerase/epimerase [Echinicola sp. CAU 1574]|uniref:Sugar phosphate isomerase/epimerase n=1 Tax=Echinicola arenosa TaxID=2774144 RepID=A0ABR9AJC8_9BACT|nr:sugar phosphate isomerase/epimerase [Echinicola arenosa]MBD8488030.1 sugar phosphate isomerase/epimerase [Echinicola arenosa]
MKERRKFLKLGAAFTAGAFLPLQFCSSPKKETATAVVEEAVAESVKETISKFGVQLYSVKEDMAADAKETIKKIAGYGYNQIEGFDGGKGIFWGMKNTEFKTFTEDLGLDFVASHANVFDNTEKLAAEAGEIGMKYLICPWIGPQESMEEWKKIADRFNEVGQICKNNVVRFAYHNHGYTFEELEGQMPQDFLLENTDPELVDYELDIYWAVTAGADPEAYFEKYKNRFRLCHVKDREKGAPSGKADASIVLGEGSIDYSKVLRTAKDNGMDYFIVEQEKFEGVSPLEAAEKNAAYLKKLEI